MAEPLTTRIEFETTISWLARMYKARDKARTEPLYDEETRKEQVESEVFMIRKLERQLAEYFRAEPLDDDSNYPEIADTLRAVEQARRNREAVENLPALPQKVG